jgi:hypothetical protein
VVQWDYAFAAVKKRFHPQEKSMKKLIIGMAMLCGMAMAQTSSGTAAPSTDTTKPAHKHMAKADKTSADNTAGAKEKTVKGCLHKDGENLWLQTRMGKYHVMSKEDISAHDGHEVKITGTTSKGPAPNDTSGKEVKHLEATKVDMVADKCAMGTKKMKMSDEEMSKKGKTKKE